jgi:phospholipid-binding lipoprotein MlaA
MKTLLRRWSVVLGLAAAVLATGCASVPTAPGGAAGAAGAALAINPVDPWERFNRNVFAFNDAVDTAVLRPVAETYVKVVPSPVRQAVSNFFGNFGDAWSAVNHLLQGQFEPAISSLARFGTNTTLGLGGLIDVAGEAGIDRRRADLGQTLGVWGVPSGPYLVLPLFGPSNVRESAAFVPEQAVSPSTLVDSTGARAALSAVSVVDTRATLLPATRMLDSIALDKYVFVRDAYLQRRQNLIEDVRGAPSAAPPADERMKTPGQPAGAATR